MKTGQPQGKRHGFQTSEVAGAVSVCTSRLPLGSADGGESPAGKPSSNPFLALKGTSRTLRARPWEETSLVQPYTRAELAGGRRMPPPFCLAPAPNLVPELSAWTRLTRVSLSQEGWGSPAQLSRGWRACSPESPDWGGRPQHTWYPPRGQGTSGSPRGSSGHLSTIPGPLIARGVQGSCGPGCSPGKL